MDSTSKEATSAEPRPSLSEVERALAEAVWRRYYDELYRRLAVEAGVDVDALGCWALFRLGDQPDRTMPVAALADRVGVPISPIAVLLNRLADRGLIDFPLPPDDAGRGGPTGLVGDRRAILTGAGRDAVERLQVARKERVERVLGGWSPSEHPELADLLGQLYAKLSGQSSVSSVDPPARG